MTDRIGSRFIYINGQSWFEAHEFVAIVLGYEKYGRHLSTTIDINSIAVNWI